MVHWLSVDVSAMPLPDRLPTSWLQQDEVDWAGFVDKAEVSGRIFVRFRPLLDRLLDRLLD